MVRAMTLPVRCSGVRCWMWESASTENIEQTNCPAKRPHVSSRYSAVGPSRAAKPAPAGRSARPKAPTSRSQRFSLGPNIPAASAPSTAAAPRTLSDAP